ncbi:hypothetical protein KP509_12G025500 [Ceratopteris richardii]|uniref:Ubiquitin-like protease family profile domain-containing protein n=1 Tax=Ceratopteris richardii TaxID=49495 RepID=A0A8T2TN06_CERRI|nr:hypothetical protein KP509_12G025500 [Ceratopteris richardii]
MEMPSPFYRILQKRKYIYMQLIDKGHWSSIIVDFNAYQALFLNSLPSQHGNCKVAAKLLKMHIHQNFPGIAKMNEQKQFGYSRIHVPL